MYQYLFAEQCLVEVCCQFSFGSLRYIHSFTSVPLIHFICIKYSRRFPINFHACFIHSTNIYQAYIFMHETILCAGHLANAVMAAYNIIFFYPWSHFQMRNSSTNSPIYYGFGHRIIFHVSHCFFSFVYSCSLCCRCGRKKIYVSFLYF